MLIADGLLGEGQGPSQFGSIYKYRDLTDTPWKPGASPWGIIILLPSIKF